MDDDELWRQCQASETAALAGLYRRHRQALYAFAMRSTGSHERAEDIVSATFLQAWDLRQSASVDNGKVLPWLYGVALNVLRSEKRTLRRYRSAIQRLNFSAEPPADEGLAERVDDEQRVRTLLPTLTALPERDRELIVLCWWGDLSYEEAAHALSIPVGTIKSRLARLRARLGAVDPEHAPTPSQQRGQS